MVQRYAKYHSAQVLFKLFKIISFLFFNHNKPLSYCNIESLRKLSYYNIGEILVEFQENMNGPPNFLKKQQKSNEHRATNNRDLLNNKMNTRLPRRANFAGSLLK